MSKRTCKDLTLDEAAERLGIDPTTAYRWAISGKLNITKRLPKTTPRILVSEDSVLDLQAATPGPSEAAA